VAHLNVRSVRFAELRAGVNFYLTEKRYMLIKQAERVYGTNIIGILPMARDIIHGTVKNALIKDGWTITHDPYVIEYKNEFLYADLGAEHPLAAERNGHKIIAEIKSFIGHSVMQDFKLALGQYHLYLPLLKITAPDYKLYLAIIDIVYAADFQRPTIQLILQQHMIPLISNRGRL